MPWRQTTQPTPPVPGGKHVALKARGVQGPPLSGEATRSLFCDTVGAGYAGDVLLAWIVVEQRESMRRHEVGAAVDQPQEVGHASRVHPDVARGANIAVPALPPTGLLGVLAESGLPFVEIPGLDLLRPATSYKVPGQTGLHVNVLCPAGRHPLAAAPLPELGCHATGMPHLRYLVAKTHTAVLLSRAGVCEVRIPAAERFALHKMVVSQRRVNRGAKVAKDLAQAATLLAALAELHPGAVEAAALGLSVSERKLVVKARPAVSALLAAHPRAVLALAGL